MSQMPWACNPILTGLELAHRPQAGNFYLRTTPELSTVLPCGEIPEYETLFLCSDRKFELAFVCLIVQRQDMAFRHTVYLKPVARTGEQRKPVYLSTSLGVAFLMHRLAVPFFVVVLRPYAVFLVFEE